MRWVVVFGLASMTLTTLPGYAQEVPCGAFTLTGGSKTTDIIDLGEPGTSAGDLRIVERQLVDADGTTVGALSGRSIILRPGGDNLPTMMGDWRIRIHDGTLVASALFDHENTDTQTTTPVDVAIVGGTGPYRGAYGTLAIGAGDKPTYDFDISCRE
ncbi:allene oxide cyclase barrel-like domain-containing protein [Bauldia sp.]|uniref:allene oxide cyclase barrel-like domain-containing protein n=1 Tax=Bauldia sp. TaxID=2575872 RepID=UPI003BAA849A